MNELIPFNKPYMQGRELEYISQAVRSGKISGDGIFTKKCQDFFLRKYNFEHTLLTTSCTDALEMSGILLQLSDGDEVIMPSYTFVSTANAFVLRGAKPIFVDSQKDNPNMDASLIEGLISPRTRAIIVVHYAGVSCDMDPINKLAKKYDIAVIEDAAQGIDSFYKGLPLGSLGSLSTFSFHETKNIISGEGGMLVVNDKKLLTRAEIIREKGTNRSSFFRGEVDKYGWVDIGSSFLPSDIIAAYLFAQLESLDDIQLRRIAIWERYWCNLSSHLQEFQVQLPIVPDYATNNGHMFYLVCQDAEQRSYLIGKLRKCGIHSVFHYQSLHSSSYYVAKHDGRILENSDFYTDCLLRLPLYYELEDYQVDFISKEIIKSLSEYSIQKGI
jgi:dTDP-4-amino-4,6-dideoxygalactose transaminase